MKGSQMTTIHRSFADKVLNWRCGWSFMATIPWHWCVLTVCILSVYYGAMGKNSHLRLNITLPETTVLLLDSVADKGTRSTFIDTAIKMHIHEVKAAHMREALKAGAIANAERDLAMAEEWFELEEEIWKD